MFFVGTLCAERLGVLSPADITVTPRFQGRDVRHAGKAGCWADLVCRQQGGGRVGISTTRRRYQAEEAAMTAWPKEAVTRLSMHYASHKCTSAASQPC